MKLEVQVGQAHWSWKWIALGLLALVVASAASGLSARPILLVALGGWSLIIFLAWASLRQPLTFVAVFLVALIVLPPFYISRLGETPIYPSSLLLPIGLGLVLARFPDFNFRFDRVAKGLGLFLAGTGLSLPFACWLSGPEVGTGSLLRWLLLTQTLLIYYLIRGGARVQESRAEQWLAPILLVAAVASAAYGIFDFFWPVPQPHPAADQFIWLSTGVFRRAQGVFYEASSFANLCGFFLVAASAAYLAREERALGFSRPWLLLFIAVLSLAVFVSFSRSAWASVLVSLLVFVGISRQVKLRRGLVSLTALAIPLVALSVYSPEIWNYFVSVRMGNLTQIFADPNLASSHRWDTWAKVFSILRDYPQYLLFGVGYKTLPYTRYFHEEIITDNGFLNLLLETGMLGLGGFLLFSAAIFSTFFGLVRRSRGSLAFWSGLLLSFWCGEWTQMMAADAYTYWRNMVVFLALMAMALNRAEREQLSAKESGGEPLPAFPGR